MSDNGSAYISPLANTVANTKTKQKRIKNIQANFKETLTVSLKNMLSVSLTELTEYKSGQEEDATCPFDVTSIAVVRLCTGGMKGVFRERLQGLDCTVIYTNQPTKGSLIKSLVCQGLCFDSTAGLNICI